MRHLSATRPMSKITRTAISRRWVNQIKKKKKTTRIIYFYTSVPIFDSKFKIPIATNSYDFFRHLENWHLTAHQTAQRQYGQKSKIG